MAVTDVEALLRRLHGETEMLLDGADPLFQPLNSFLYLTVGELDERTSFSELIIHMLTVIGMTPIEVYLEAFSHKLKFMPESFSKDACVAFRIGNFSAKGPGKICPKGFGRSADNLLNLGKRFLIHMPPFEQANIMASVAISQTGLPASGSLA
ncbi:MAG: hypothetical protein K2Q17_17390 [Nitrospiraceae bacterium]|jgi:hypothetical protein|uniref:hypothetical protein n=1 Tax=Nitrospira cf. moscoviensis SBR1015 TaxID=96242 RepID=UPI0011233DA7|nr:hypothetical protein [Nitrospira cf. moscoviensis SBR1015]MBY0249431.1 hypothetical protein [Nitrospiraceae bacterium]